MMTEKKWERIGEHNYYFFVDNIVIGSLEMLLADANSSAQIKIDDQIYTIKRTGFWKNVIEITDVQENVIAKMSYQKWYANIYQLNIYQDNYTVSIKNAPLATWFITDQVNKEILAYGLDSHQGELAVKISSTAKCNYLLDFLLWYLFYPIAFENFANKFRFINS